MAKPDPPWYHPFPNPSIAHVMMWENLTDNANSDAATDGVVDIFLWDDVNKKDLAGFSSKRENDRLDKFVDTPPGEPPNGWQRGAVKLKLPCVGVCTAEEDAFEIEIDGIYYCPLLDTLKEALQSLDFNNFHLTPFEPRCNPNHDPCRPQDDSDDDTTELDEHGLPPLPPGHLRLYAEAYTSPRMLKAYKAFEKLPPSKIERVRVAYMFFSDATHLASFGDASIWPLYTFFGNFPKDLRAKPTENLAYHQGYFPSLPYWVKDKYSERFGKNMPDAVETHLKRELMHAVWDMLLDDEFVKTCEEGLEIVCYDKIPRQFFPWIYLYGADYPEKILLATIHCRDRHETRHAASGKGAEVDAWWISQVNKSREAIFDRGLGVNSTFVEQLLKENSWVPTKNAFAKMADVGLGLNLFSLFVPDVLHEVEIGVVKAVFIHIVRLLYAHGASAVNKLDERFRQVPTFGRATIRKFHRNVSEMKQFAARDHEDTLQIPVLEGLYPALEKLLLDTSFDLAAFHGMAKLRLHTSKTLTDFRIRKFGRDTRAIKTVETLREYNRRVKRAETVVGKSTANSAAAQPTSTRREKVFNVETPKFHALGYYPDSVEQDGTLDSHTTQNSEAAHKKPKIWYGKTNKRNHVAQIAKRERRQRLLRAMQARLAKDSAEKAKRAAVDAAGILEDGDEPRQLQHTHRSITATILREALQPNEVAPRAAPSQHHRISESKRTWWKIDDLPCGQMCKQDVGSDADDSMSDSDMDSGDNQCDPALKDFVIKLENHIRRRLLGIQYDGTIVDYTREERYDVEIKKGKLYTHATMRLNYTTYDMRREQDSINPRTRAAIMLPAQGDADPHPYWYAWVLGIFHVDVRLRCQNKPFERLEFLWVRWLSHDMSYRSGWEAKRLPRVAFMPHGDRETFGFLDPNDVLRGSHLIPAFHHGRTTELLPPSIARKPTENHEDWSYFYVGFFVDRDMLMRYRTGDGVGHRTASSPDAARAAPSCAETPMDVDSDPEPEDPEAPIAVAAISADGAEGNSDWEADHDEEPENNDEEEEQLPGNEADEMDLAVLYNNDEEKEQLLGDEARLDEMDLAVL
ncbi:hypothetical protein GGX14DRAFT_607548 [Mycena pura]|uniref:Uncharacterized protein n=1 Tax=Mycena pura TaxID=153505 RepID=A0AAD6ULK6_9AGAR|nr:hypothetical protein GGX14DRAFT_607548 [Mycena pura]